MSAVVLTDMKAPILQTKTFQLWLIILCHIRYYRIQCFLRRIGIIWGWFGCCSWQIEWPCIRTLRLINFCDKVPHFIKSICYFITWNYSLNYPLLYLWLILKKQNRNEFWNRTHFAIYATKLESLSYISIAIKI